MQYNTKAKYKSIKTQETMKQEYTIGRNRSTVEDTGTGETQNHRRRNRRTDEDMREHTD